MIKNIFIFSVLLLLIVLSLGQKGQQDKKDISAYIVKVIRDVNMKSPATGWQKAVPLSTLKSGYEVQTDKNSLAMILFADQSKLILREKTNVTIKGEVQGKEILSRSVHMDRGNMIFNVKKAETEQFRFSSPISVASIRGTQGGYVSGGRADSLTIAEGLADFTNSMSGKTGHVGTGHTGVADSSGNFNIHQASSQTLNSIINGQNLGENSSSDSVSNNSGSVGADFDHLKSKQAGSVHVNLSSFQGKAVAASLFYRKQNEQSFTELPLTITGQTAQGQLSANKVKYPKLEYYLSIKLNDSSSTILPQDGPSKPAVVPVEAVQHMLRIPGQTGTLQEKVLVLKWND
jgi:FecR protein